ncbi:hypothetical protein A9P44_18950 [Paenibacillus polymyxa]|nr:hypothetical protein [Paenibacillus polymyxa]OBA04114.1 hypothetical protein A9P44_18950 [Paenibacillus polymyxa]
MTTKQPDSVRNPEALNETNIIAREEETKPYLQFFPGIASLKELNLTGIEPILPPAYKRRPSRDLILE